jgi:glycosyltransferase involved in cell wall biosynthesis
VVLGHGSDRQMEDLLALRRELALEDHVSFLGFRQDARRLLSGLDVFVSSSSTEGFSLSTVEALWVGKPVVATRSGGPEEIVRDGETALLVPTRSPAALADGVERLLRDPALARRLGEDGKRHVRQRFSRERMVANYEEVYREALDARRSRSQLRASLAAG